MKVLKDNSEQALIAARVKMTCKECKSIIEIDKTDWINDRGCRISNHGLDYCKCPVCKSTIFCTDGITWSFVIFMTIGPIAGAALIIAAAIWFFNKIW